MQENHFPERVQFTIYNCSTSRLRKNASPEGHGFSRAEKMLRWTGFSRRGTVFLGQIAQEG